MRPRSAAALLLFAVITRPVPVAPQEPCRIAPPAPPRAVNLFSLEQEAVIGDLALERFGPLLNVIEDDRLTGELRRIGGRLAAHLPAGAPSFEFHLADLPDVNAFVLPGGRIYVSRRLVGFAKSEDELAGVMAHEMGHILARQRTLDLSRQIRAVLKVDALGDRDHVVATYNRLMDNWARKPHLFEIRDGHDSANQIEADRLGVQLLAAAGYDVQAFGGFYDRVAETEGKTGSLLSRILGTDSPESRRLREILRATGKAAPACVAAARVAAAPDAFRAWQSQVLAFRGSGRAERLAGVVSRTTLAQPLRGELTHLRFSPDGRLLLAQDPAGISLLSREPFQTRVRIPAPGAEPARFTPDSQALLWHSNDLHIERWSVAAGRLVEARDIVLADACEASALSPDGAVVSCLEPSGDLSLFDVLSGQRRFEQTGFHRVNVLAMALNAKYGGHLPTSYGPLTMRFSPDARFFVAAYGAGVFVYDVAAGKPLTLPDAAKALLTRSFAFVAPDRVIGVNPANPALSAVLALPRGEILDAIQLTRGQIDRTTAGDFLLVRPMQKYAVGLLNPATSTFIKAHPMPAFDVYADVFAAERGTGDVGLYAMTGNALIAAATLPTAPLRAVQAAAVSPDFRWLAASGPARGAIWDLSRNVRLGRIRPFAGASFDAEGGLFADLPRTLAEPRVLMRLDPLQDAGREIAHLEGQFATQRGPWLLLTRTLPPGAPQPTALEYELRDVRRTEPVWTAKYAENPPVPYIGPGADALVLSWPAHLPDAHARIRKDERLRAAVKGYELEGDLLIEVLDGASGDLRGRMVIETGKGSFTILDLFALRDRVVVTDSLGRVVVYTLSSGEPEGYAFGHSPIVHPGSGRLAVESGRGRIVLYELPGVRRLRQLAFEEDVVLKSFNADGSRLFVLTADHTTFVIDVSEDAR